MNEHEPGVSVQYLQTVHVEGYYLGTKLDASISGIIWHSPLYLIYMIVGKEY